MSFKWMRQTDRRLQGMLAPKAVNARLEEGDLRVKSWRHLLRKGHQPAAPLFSLAIGQNVLHFDFEIRGRAGWETSYMSNIKHQTSNIKHHRPPILHCTNFLFSYLFSYSSSRPVALSTRKAFFFCLWFCFLKRYISRTRVLIMNFLAGYCFEGVEG